MYIQYILTILFFRSINCFHSPDLPYLNNPIITSSELLTSYNIGKIAKKSISKIDINPNITRKIVHITSAPTFISTWGLYNDYYPNLWASIVPFSISLYIYFNTEKFKNLLSRNGDKTEILKGPLLYTIILSLITLTNWMDKPYGIITISQLSFGDGFSDIIGRKYGNTKWIYNTGKSIEGSISFLIFSFIGTLIILNFFNNIYGCSYDYSLENIFIISLICSLIETIPIIDDNISVPITALLLSYYLF